MVMVLMENETREKRGSHLGQGNMVYLSSSSMVASLVIFVSSMIPHLVSTDMPSLLYDCDLGARDAWRCFFTSWELCHISHFAFSNSLCCNGQTGASAVTTREARGSEACLAFCLLCFRDLFLSRKR